MPKANPIKTCPGCLGAEVRKALPVEQLCTSCRKKERNRLWRLDHPGAMAANAKKWRAAGNKSTRPESYTEQHRASERERYRTADAATRECIKARNKTHRERLGAALLAAQAREWRAKNPGKTREYHERQVAKLSPDVRREQGKQHRVRYKAQRQADAAAYNARRYGGTGVITNKHLVGLHRWQDHCCFYCREPLKGAETIEHVVPLSRRGSNNPWNVTLACSYCNTRKNNSLFCLEWQPDHVAPAPRYHSIYGMNRLKAALSGMSIPFADHTDHLIIRGHAVFILSSFWLGWAGDATVKMLKEKYPTATMFFDKEFVRRPDVVISILKARTGTARLKLSTETKRTFFYATPEADGFYSQRDFRKQVLEAKAEYFDPDATQAANAKANGLIRVECFRHQIRPPRTTAS